MSRGQRIPPPASIEAISRLEEIEEIASEFEQRNGYAPELLSYWDPKPAFEATVEAWVGQGATARTSLVQYAFSSYLTKEDRLFTRLKEPVSRGFVFTNSGTSSIATVISYLSNIRIRRLHIINPAYHAVEALAKGYGIATSFASVVRNEGRYALPESVAVGENDALWLTSPIYGASCYLDGVRVGHVIDTLPPSAIVIVDEGLAYLDRGMLTSTRSLDRVIRIVTPHKPLCVNGEKVSIITMPAHLSEGLNALSECFAGGIGAAGLRALNFIMSESYEVAQAECRTLCRDQHRRMRKIVDRYPHIALDADPDGHFVLLYWPTIAMSAITSYPVLSHLIEESGAVPMPASRNMHPEQYGFCFRVNLFRLDDAGLGGLKRLCDALAPYASTSAQ